MSLCVSEFNVSTGKKIMEIRLQRHYTRDCLAEMADISSKFLYEVEVGKKGCSSYVLYRLADSLEVSVDYLLDHETANTKDLDDICKHLHGSQREVVAMILRILYDNFQKI